MNIFDTTKILAFPERIAEYRDRGVAAPITMELDLTTACPHKCPQCSGGGYRGQLTGDEARAYVKQLADYGVLGLIFTGGGEPLAHPEALDVVEFARGLGLQVGFITNGSLLTEAIAVRLLTVCAWVRVSLDAGNPCDYAATHGQGEDEFWRVVDSIAMLGRLRQECHSRCTVGVGYLTGPATVGGMVDATRLVRNSGVDYLQFRPFHWSGRLGIGEQLVACEALQTPTFRVLSSAHKYERFGETERPYTRCHGAAFVGVIQADHHVTLCCHTRGRPQFYLGDLREQSFRSIWEGERKAAVVGSLDLGRCVPFCRCDSINRVLESATAQHAHAAFL